LGQVALINAADGIIYTAPDKDAWEHYQLQHAVGALNIYRLEPPGSQLDTAADHVLLMTDPSNCSAARHPTLSLRSGQPLRHPDL
jgi:hypothetical protein